LVDGMAEAPAKSVCTSVSSTDKLRVWFGHFVPTIACCRKYTPHFAGSYEDPMRAAIEHPATVAAAAAPEPYNPDALCNLV
jgi:hypothetical protein